MRLHRIVPVLSLLLLLPASVGAGETQAPFPSEAFGVYRLTGGGELFVIAEEGSPMVGLPGGQVRGLFPDPPGGYRYGSALMIPEPLEGRIVFGAGGGGAPTVTWSPVDGEPRTGERIPIRKEEVRFKNGRTRLAGTLHLPPGAPPYPAVILLHGSGPEERGPGFYEFFFSRLGMAVLSYDKRGTGQSGGKEWRAPFETYARDALAGLGYLKTRPDIRGDRIGLHGPSQGGWIAPLAASLSSDVAFVIIRSGNAVSPRRQNLFRVQRFAEKKTELDAEQIASILEYVNVRMDHVVAGRSRKEFEPFLAAKNASSWGRYVSDSLPSSDFWRPNADHDPEPALRATRCPILVLLGEEDNSTSAAENAPVFRRILSDSEHPDYTVHVFPRANHALFETDSGRLMEDELAEIKRIVPGYMETMDRWLGERFLPPPAAGDPLTEGGEAE